METLIIKSQEQAEKLASDGVLNFEGNIVFKCVIYASWSITAGGYIEAGESIEAGGYIKAGGYITAGGSIKAGDDWGISCGFSMRISMQSNATITARAEPKNILLGKFVQAA